MAGLLGKKGQLLDFIIVFLIIVSAGAVLQQNLSAKDKVIEMGGRQFTMLSAYAEGEKALEYMQTAGKISIAQAVRSCEGAETLSGDAIALNAAPIVRKYIANYTRSSSAFNVTMPSDYTFTAANYIGTDGKIWLVGITDENIKVFSSKFTYSISGNFRTSVSCDEIKALNSPSTVSLING